MIIFGADVSSSVHIDNKGKYILILGDVPTQELDDSTLIAEAKCPINFTEIQKKAVLRLASLFVLSLTCFLMLQKYINSKPNCLK